MGFSGLEEQEREIKVSSMLCVSKILGPTLGKNYHRDLQYSLMFLDVDREWLIYFVLLLGC